jgi:hypothetical protein
MSAVATRSLGWSKKDSYQAQNANQTRGLALIQGGSGDNYLANAAAANVVCRGVQEESSVAAGDPINCIELGDAVCIAGAAINAGQFFKCNASGQFIPITGTAGDGENIVGVAKSSATTAGDEFVGLIYPSVN